MNKKVGDFDMAEDNLQLLFCPGDEGDGWETSGKMKAYKEADINRNGEYGMMSDGVIYLPPKPYGATVAVLRDGSTAFGSWGRRISTLASSREANSSSWRWRAPSCRSRHWFWPTSPRPTSTRRRPST